VYWRAEGRSSLEAVAIVSTVGLLVVLGVRPFELDDPGSAITVTAAIGAALALAAVAILKGRIMLGAVGLFVVPVSLLAAVRLARPGSPWARRRYPAGSARLLRAERRFENPTAISARLSRSLMDAVGGRPS
jgi:hypothetical protein